MKITRPFTAEKQNLFRKPDSRLTISRFKRPISAKTQSLKQIIQVIENTLNQGAHTILNKAKTLDKFSKVKIQQQVACNRKLKERNFLEREFPQFNTQFYIGNSSQFQKSILSIKSAKKITEGADNVEFIPYDKQHSNKVEEKVLKFGLNPNNKGKRLQKQGKIVREKQNKKQQMTVIDRWQNQSSILNLQYLLHGRKFA